MNVWLILAISILAIQVAFGIYLALCSALTLCH